MTHTFKGFSSDKPEDIQKMKDLLFREPTEAEMTAKKPKEE